MDVSAIIWGNEFHFAEAAFPSGGDFPWLKLYIFQAVCLEFFRGPLVGFLEILAACHAGADDIAEVCEIGFDLGSIFDFGQEHLVDFGGAFELGFAIGLHRGIANEKCQT
jgi:hypothetical protein